MSMPMTRHVLLFARPFDSGNDVHRDCGDMIPACLRASASRRQIHIRQASRAQEYAFHIKLTRLKVLTCLDSS